MNIRQISSKEEIYKVLLSCKNDFFSLQMHDEKKLREFADKYSQNAIVFVAEENKDVLGFIAFYANDLVSHSAFISSIVIKKQYQSKGIGSQLLDKAEEYVRLNNMTSMALEVDKMNEKAIKLYMKKGYVFVDEQTNMMKIQLF